MPPFLEEAAREFRRQKDLADRAVSQLSEEQLFKTLDAESNSVALIAKHVGGNLRSRWRDFLTTDGEKTDRNRDSEFEAGAQDNRATLAARWEDGWSILFETLAGLTGEDLDKTVTIRGENFTVLQAVQRGLTHAAYHVGQIVFLAKHLAGKNWKTLSIPRGKSGQTPGDYLKR